MTSIFRTLLFSCLCAVFLLAIGAAASATTHPELRGVHSPDGPMKVSEYNRIEAERKHALATLVGRVIVVSAQEADCRTVDPFHGSANFGAPQPKGTRARIRAVKGQGALTIHPEGNKHFVAVGVQEGDKALRLDAVNWSQWCFEDGSPLPSPSPTPLPEALEFSIGDRLALPFSDISASTGYMTEWKVRDPELLAFTEEDDSCSGDSCSAMVPGAARKRLAVFRALKSGATSIEFSKGRPWEADSMYRKTYRVTVVAEAVSVVEQ